MGDTIDGSGIECPDCNTSYDMWTDPPKYCIECGKYLQPIEKQ